MRDATSILKIGSRSTLHKIMKGQHNEYIGKFL